MNLFSRRRLSPPVPDRWWLPVIESVKFHIDNIERGLLLNTDDPVPAFRAVLKSTEALNQVVRLGAIQEERKSYRIIQPGELK